MTSPKRTPGFDSKHQSDPQDVKDSVDQLDRQKTETDQTKMNDDHGSPTQKTEDLHHDNGGNQQKYANTRAAFVGLGDLHDQDNEEVVPGSQRAEEDHSDERTYTELIAGNGELQELRGHEDRGRTQGSSMAVSSCRRSMDSNDALDTADDQDGRSATSHGNGLSNNNTR